MISIKFVNDVGRVSIDLLQKVLSSKLNQEQIYHIFQFLLTYCTENYDLSEDIKDLLNELILLIGYYTVLNPENQS